MTIKQLRIKISQAEKRLAVERDKLRDLLSEVQCLIGPVEQACDSLRSATDALSEVV